MNHKTIWKYSIATTDYQELTLPNGANILTVQVQGGIPCLWALVDPEEQNSRVKIRIFGTGHVIEDQDELKYIGTYQLNGGGLVFHVFTQD